jgi:flagellar FliL protein
MPAPAADAPPADAPAAPAGRSIPIPLVLAVVAGLAVGAGTGFFAVGPALATGIAPAVAAGAARAKAAKSAAGDDAEGGEHDEAAGDDGEGGDGDAKGGDGKAAAAAPVYTLDNIVLNPAESGGTRFLLLTIAFELKSQETHDAMKARDAELRDLVLATLGNKTVEQLSDVTTRDSLKTELRTVAGKLFRTKSVKRVYFPQFVIQ